MKNKKPLPHSTRSWSSFVDHNTQIPICRTWWNDNVKTKIRTSKYPHKSKIFKGGTVQTMTTIHAQLAAKFTLTCRRPETYATEAGSPGTSRPVGRQWTSRRPTVRRRATRSLRQIRSPACPCGRWCRAPVPDAESRLRWRRPQNTLRRRIAHDDVSIGMRSTWLVQNSL